jgi:hypothetical protein
LHGCEALWDLRNIFAHPRRHKAVREIDKSIERTIYDFSDKEKQQHENSILIESSHVVVRDSLL